uniref:Uncharacterized protein n=1 Tax=Candidatus Kentrum sp. UNK TaxID=2126344 RepID=A0A451AIL2_9GAMM|nr:MAG: hypothetical protein BECKUNK1418G_GA0071005_107112 [Candidatus Kentron sp. UNK]VFK71573.1 MAG: hypothetical protein BECKUNK1418H_GA0071006_107212 [Candidatus Kentron sp. UNK]
MNTTSFAIRINDNPSILLGKVDEPSGRNRSGIVREAIERKQRQPRIIRFCNLRAQVTPFAEAQGYLTDEDVFADVS